MESRYEDALLELMLPDECRIADAIAEDELVVADFALMATLLVVVEEAKNVVFLELGAALEEVEFDGEAEAGDLAA